MASKQELEDLLKKEIERSALLQRELDDLKRSVPKQETDGRAKIDGISYTVVRRGTARAIMDAMQKRFIHEDHTVLVLDRHGD